MPNPLLPTVDPVRAERRRAAVLFIVTCASVFLVRFVGWQPELDVSFGERLVSSALFSVALMGILFAHEMGHFVAARVHAYRISWPFFLPFPYFVGTLGAFIRFTDKPPHRKGLVEMAAFGPISGFVAIGIFLILWMMLFEPVPPGNGEWSLGTPAIFSVVHLLFKGSWMVSISVYDPFAFAAWIGCLITSLNLLPFGQLDGGHIVSGYWPKHARVVSWFVTCCLLIGGLWWAGWLVWAVVLHAIGSRHPADVINNRTAVSSRAKWSGGACLIVFSLCFVPIPVVTGS